MRLSSCILPTRVLAVCVISVVVMVTSARRANAQALAFGQQVSLQSKHSFFLVASPDGDLDADREDAGPWERFRLTDPKNPVSTQPVHFGDEVALLSAHQNYVVAESDGSASANRPELGAWEIWTLVHPLDPGRTGPVRPRDAVALRSSHDTFLVAEADGRVNANRVEIGPWETWRIGRDWTDFYYDVARACPPGQCCPCPYRGRFDGANCFVARPPMGSSPLLIDGEFAYDGVADCGFGSPDGTRCRLGTNPAAPRPFLHDGGFYLSPLCTPAGQLSVHVERVAHCTGLICSHRLTRQEFSSWKDSDVPRNIQRNTHIGVVFGPAQQPARRVALLLAGQQFQSGTRNLLTGQPNDFKSGWNVRQPGRDFTLDDDSLAQRLVTENILDPADSFLAVAFDARFNHKFNKDDKERIENAYVQWLRSKFDPAAVEFVYLAGFSRGGCLAMRIARRLQAEIPQVPIVVQSFDGVCNRHQRELGIEFPGRVRNPLVDDSDVFAWPTDLRQEFRNHQSALAVLHIVGGYSFLSDLDLVRAFSQANADEPELDLCWYQQRWVDLGHGALGGQASVQPALDHLQQSLARFAQGPPCPAAGRCVKDPRVWVVPFECNDLTPADCATQTECRVVTTCRNGFRPLPCSDLSEVECGTYSSWCRWQRRDDRCVARLSPIWIWNPFTCADLQLGDCGNHTQCGLIQKCKKQGRSLKCADLFTQEQCDRYTRWCDWE